MHLRVFSSVQFNQSVQIRVTSTAWVHLRWILPGTLLKSPFKMGKIASFLLLEVLWTL